MQESAPYLQPYLNAAKKYGSGFGTLLWASPKTQAARFNALLHAIPITGRSLLDVGCGRADLLEFLLRHRTVPARYIGLEAVEELATAAESKLLPNAQIVRGDFVHNPRLMDIQADIIYFSGSLNTLDEPAFYRCLYTAFNLAKQAVVFNFLSSESLAATSYLTWHKTDAVLAFANTLSQDVRLWDDYLAGDTTVALGKEKCAL